MTDRDYQGWNNKSFSKRRELYADQIRKEKRRQMKSLMRKQFIERQKLNMLNGQYTQPSQENNSNDESLKRFRSQIIWNDNTDRNQNQMPGSYKKKKEQMIKYPRLDNLQTSFESQRNPTYQENLMAQQPQILGNNLAQIQNLQISPKINETPKFNNQSPKGLKNSPKLNQSQRNNYHFDQEQQKIKTKSRVLDFSPIYESEMIPIQKNQPQVQALSFPVQHMEMINESYHQQPSYQQPIQQANYQQQNSPINDYSFDLSQNSPINQGINQNQNQAISVNQNYFYGNNVNQNFGLNMNQNSGINMNQNFGINTNQNYYQNMNLNFGINGNQNYAPNNLFPKQNLQQNYAFNPLGINFVNILSNEKIFQDSQYQNQYFQQHQKFRNLLKYNSPQQDLSPNNQGIYSSPSALAFQIYPEETYQITKKENIQFYHQYKIMKKQMEISKQEIKIYPYQLKQNHLKELKQLIQNEQKMNLNLDLISPNKKKQKIYQKKSQKGSKKLFNQISDLVVLKMYKKYAVLDKVLGKGSYGSVYLGLNIDTKEKIAVKKIIIKKQKHFMQVECLKQIRHKNIVTLYDYLLEKDKEQCYLFMEYCEENLREKLDKMKTEWRKEAQNTEKKIKFIEQIIEGVNQLNEKGFIHRDLKLQNFLIKDNLVLKICDFGLCRKVNRKLEVDSVRCGTPYTMSPEIFFNENGSQKNIKYTQKADIFSVAVLMYEIIYDKHPFNYEENRLKNLEISDKLLARKMKDKFFKEYKLDIAWIDKIIEGGLKLVQERISWTQIMDIYKNKEFYKMETNKLENLFNNGFKKKAVYKEFVAQPISNQKSRFIGKSNFSKIQKRKPFNNPEEKSTPSDSQKKDPFTKDKINQNLKNQVKSAEKPKDLQKVNLSRKIEFNPDIKKDIFDLKNLQKDMKKPQIQNIIEGKVENKVSQVTSSETILKLEQSKKGWNKNFKIFILVLNILLGFILIPILVKALLPREQVQSS